MGLCKPPRIACVVSHGMHQVKCEWPSSCPTSTPALLQAPWLMLLLVMCALPYTGPLLGVCACFLLCIRSRGDLGAVSCCSCQLDLGRCKPLKSAAAAAPVPHCDALGEV